MNYNTVSIENVIGRIIRNTKLSDTSAMMDIYEWIPEAMEELETRYQLEPKAEPLEVRFHQAKLPCGLAYIDAVSYGGRRLDYSEQIRKPESKSSVTTIFQSTPELIVNPATGNSFAGWTLEQVKQSPLDGHNYYWIKPNYLCTSMRDAHVWLYFMKVPTDDNGFPLIPDNGNYKQALYWYVRGKLIESGQLADKFNTPESCTFNFEKYGRRAINEITYPSVDKMERMRANQVRFNIDENYWNNYNHS